MRGFRRFLKQFRPVRPSPAARERIRKACVEALEERRLFTAAYALIGDAGTTLIRFDTTNPTVIQNAVSVSGLQPGETLQGIDFRPTTGVLYALGIVNPDAGTDTARLYTINTDTGAATQLGTQIGGLADGSRIGFDFNPAADRIRVVNAADQSFRLNPNDGSLAGTDTNLDKSGDSEAITAVAYDRNDKDPATPTTLFGLDFGLDDLVMIGGVNGSPSPNMGAVTKVGDTGVTSSDPNLQFDIAPDGSAFAIIPVGGLAGLYSISLSTGAATLVNLVGNGADTTRGFAINVDSVANAPDAVNDTYTTPINTPLTVPAKGVLTNDTDPNGDTITVANFTQPANGAVAVNPDGSFTYTPNSFFIGTDTFTYRATDGTNTSISATVSITVTPSNLMAVGLVGASTLVKFLTNAPGTIIDTVPVQGLQPGEKLLGVDFRPANGRLYGLGSSGRVYRIDENTGATTSATLAADPTDVTNPFTALNGASLGVDFNPVPDRLRVTSNTGQNLRINVDTGATITDDPLNPGTPDVVGAGYLNPDADPATGTTLYTIDRTANALNIQNPPNNGTQTQVGTGLGVDVSGDIGFDVARDGRGFLAATDAGTGLSRFYTVSLASGGATLIGNVGNGAQGLSGLAVQLEGIPVAPPPVVTINDVSQAEGNAGLTPYVFTLTRTGDLSGTSTVQFATAFGNAVTSAEDLDAQSGVVTFTPGQATQTITINVKGDTKVEQDNLFFVNLTSPTNATPGDNQGRGDILNDDSPTPTPTPAPTLAINNLSKAEGNAGLTPFVFTVTRMGNTSGTTTVQYATAFGNAVTSIEDLDPQSGTVTFTAGQTSRTITINVKGDTKVEQNNLFFVNLSSPVNGVFGDNQGRGDILNDD